MSTHSAGSMPDFGGTRYVHLHLPWHPLWYPLFIYCTSAAVAFDSSHMIASSSALWNRFSPSSDFVNGHMSTMWFVVCLWPQSQKGDRARPPLCKLAPHGVWPVQKWFVRDRVWRGKSKPGYRIVGSVTTVWLTTEADNQSSLHCTVVLTGVMSNPRLWNCHLMALYKYVYYYYCILPY